MVRPLDLTELTVVLGICNKGEAIVMSLTKDWPCFYKSIRLTTVLQLILLTTIHYRSPTDRTGSHYIKEGFPTRGDLGISPGGGGIFEFQEFSQILKMFTLYRPQNSRPKCYNLYWPISDRILKNTINSTMLCLSFDRLFEFPVLISLNSTCMHSNT